jgi:hypothetical protein
LQYPRPTVIHFEGEINSLHYCELVFHVSNNVEMMMMVFQVPNMESEPTTSDRLDKILELVLQMLIIAGCDWLLVVSFSSPKSFVLVKVKFMLVVLAGTITIY